MPTGPGKYDDLCTEIRNRTLADGVVLIVLGGVRGPGFSVQLPFELRHRLPDILETMVQSIRAELADQAAPKQ